jgi:hypothetical protein
VKNGWTAGGSGSDIGTEYTLIMTVTPDVGGNFLGLTEPAVSLAFSAEDVAADAPLKTEINTF